MNVLIRPENAADRDAIWKINQLAFGGEAEEADAEWVLNNWRDENLGKTKMTDSNNNGQLIE